MMKNKIIISLLTIIICFAVVGCGNNEETNITKLDEIYEKVEDFSKNTNVDHSNLVDYYLDKTNSVVIIELKDNTTVAQERFLKSLNIDSKSIKFGEVELAKLDEIHKKIEDYLANENAERFTLSSYGIDTQNKVINITLVENSKENQDKFLTSVGIDSKYINFAQGGPYQTSVN